MRPLLLTILICLPLTTFAEQPSDTSEEPYEIIVGVTTYQDVLENFGHPLYTTKTEDGNQVWAYGRTSVESADDDSVPEHPGSMFIEFDKDAKVVGGQAMTTDQILDFKEERGCGPLIGAKEWYSLSQKTKVEVVRGFIQMAKQDGIIIKQSPRYYAKEVDTVLAGPHNPEIIPVGIALRTIAVMDGDWDDGSGNKLGVANKYLGPGLLKYMREADPEKYEKLLED